MSEVRVIGLDQVPPIELPRGSWSRMLVTKERVEGNESALGFSVFTPGTEVPQVAHEVEEAAYVVSGRGELRLDREGVPFKEGDALFIPPGVWHAVVNTGEEDMTMVFCFPHPEYPPTDRRDPGPRR